jgi:hypothetical protein
MKPPPAEGADWFGDCLFCGKEKHFYVNIKREVWDCKVCGKSGNKITLLTKIYEAALAKTKIRELETLSKHRSLPVSVLKKFGVAWHADLKRWLIPGKSTRGTIHDLRQYDIKKKLMLSVAGCKTQLLGQDLLTKAREGSTVWLCEGEWDAMALRWLLDEAGTGKTDTVVAVPGASVFKNEWTELFQGKHVIACYDADSAGELGATKAKKLLGSVSRSLKFVVWPESRPKGYDIRDHVTKGLETASTEMVLSSLKGFLSDKPRKSRSGGSSDGEEEEKKTELEPIELDELMKTFEQSILLTNDLRRALVVSLATCFSNDIDGDPLWMYIVGPPGAGKTMILQSFKDTQRCIFRSTVTTHSLVSGWRGDGPNDPSLVPKLKGLTLVAKDFTEVLSMPSIAQDEIFSTLRGAYDGMVQKSYGNGVFREYVDCRFSMLAGVTNAIHGSKTASLGERFLKLQLSKIEGDAADAIVRAAMASVGKERETEEGLRVAVARFLSKRIDPSQLAAFPDALGSRLMALVQLVAFLRAQVERDRWSQDILYRPSPEAGTRLVKQLTKLGMGVAFVLSKPTVDAEVYEIVERVAFDTAYGFNLDIVDAMMKAGGSATRADVADRIGVGSSSLSRRFDDLLALGILVPGKKIIGPMGRPAVIYEVAEAVQRLWMRAKGEQWKPKASKSKSSNSKSILVRRRRLAS